MKVLSPFTTEISGLKMMGVSKSMLKVYQLIKKIAQSDATVLIHGETGTGKELTARAIHVNSKRKRGPFVVVNCSAFAEHLFESELFGHVKGAYTGAWNDKKGRFELADGGTLFLDEIGELSQNFQVKLLRVLQEKAFEKVGGTKTLKVDVRILAATNRQLKKEVQNGRFRQDLFYRLNVIKINVPPLRERKEDIPLLVRHFISKYSRENSKYIAGISNSAMDVLKNYSFPGNVRELGNVIESAVVLSGDGKIRIDDLSEEISRGNNLCKITDKYTGEQKDRILKTLKNIKVVKCRKFPIEWYKTLKCIPIFKICDFLTGSGDQWFSRKEFANFLRNHSKSDKDKYKTAGEYLKILKQNKVCVHNGKKANKSRYRLDARFFSKAENCPHHPVGNFVRRCDSFVQENRRPFKRTSI
jgi:transcriptional regulator with GAF, ATPase, and Fis domain